MSRARAFSSPELVPASTSHTEKPEDVGLEGLAANVKLLLKLIHNHNDASAKDQDDRKMQRVAGMMTILDDVKTRIQRTQTFGKKSEAVFRRCNTDLRPNRAPRDKKPHEPITDEKEKLRRQLSASLAARKSLEMMCSSLGKEKEIIASELARKVQEQNGMEELINDLKVQNETLLAKVQVCAAEHKEKKGGAGGEAQGNVALQERNKALSEQLLKSLDGYRYLKRKYKDVQEENLGIRRTMEEMGLEIATGLDQVRGFRQRMVTKEELALNIEEEISVLESLFECFNMKISKHEQKKSECAKPKAEINSTKPSVIA